MVSSIGDRDYYQRFYSTRDWRFYEPLLAHIVSLAEPGPILDLGAGTGFFVEAAMRRGLQCVGLEGSAAALEIGHRRFEGIELMQHLLDDPLPFEKESFQTVVMNQVIEHLAPDTATRLMAECHRVLRSGGLFYVTSPSKYNVKERLADPTHINLYSPSQLHALLRQTGFGRIQAYDTPLTPAFSNALTRRIVSTLFRYTRWDRLSASANCAAYKVADGT